MDEENATELGNKEGKGVEQKSSTPMEEINEALKSCAFGLFHIRLLCSSFFGVISGIIITNTTPYLLPNAECDLKMNLVQKGVLNAAPYIGMLLSSIAAGFLTDTFGRKKFIVAGNGGIFLFTLLSAMSQTFEMLVMGLPQHSNAILTFTSEFCHKGIRDRVMLLQSSFKALGQIITAGLSMAVLTQDWRLVLFDGYIVLNTWNFYLLLSSLASLFACIMYTFLPESPKFLLTQHKYAEARTVIANVYKENNRGPTNNFPYPDIWKNQTISKTMDEAKPKSFGNLLISGLHNVKPMFQKPLSIKLGILCTINFLIMSFYNVIRLWFPQLSTVVEHYPLDGNNDMCIVIDEYTDDLKLRSFNKTSEICVPTTSGLETYTNSMIIGVVCLLPCLISGALVNKLGKNRLIMIAGGLTIGCTFGLRWANTKTTVVALFATNMAVGQSMMSLIQMTTVEIFPTASRTLAVAITMSFGRTGTLVGNIVFPVLLSMGCVIPFYTLCCVMLCVTLLTLCLPGKKT